MLFNMEQSAWVDQQGYKATKSGKWFEDEVEKVFLERGVIINAWGNATDIFEKKATEHTPAILYKNVPYENMFGDSCVGEFVLRLFRLVGDHIDIRVECRHQQSPGSVDEKVPCLIGNCKYFEQKNTILVVDGDGMRSNVRKWLVKEAERITTTTDRNVMVFRLDELKKWSNYFLGKKRCTL